MSLTTATIKKLRALHLEESIFDKVLEIIEEAKAKPPKKGDSADRATRGTRLSKDWVLPKPWGDYALVQGLREAEVRREAEQFRNYWTGVAGSKGIKLDWEGTWRNRVLSVAERLGRAPLPPVGGPVATVGPSTFTRETWEAIVRRWRTTSQWKPEHGPRPGAKNCLVPPDLLTTQRKTLFDADVVCQK